MHLFRSAVLARHNYTCLFYGCRLRSVLDAAHIRSYACDQDHRANPANGICLCRFCHAAFDAGDIVVNPDGQVVIVRPTDDPIAMAHCTSVPGAMRRSWMQGVDCRFLMPATVLERKAFPTKKLKTMWSSVGESMDSSSRKSCSAMKML